MLSTGSLISNRQHFTARIKPIRIFNGFKSGELFIHTIYLRCLFTHTHTYTRPHNNRSNSTFIHIPKRPSNIKHDHPWELNQTFNDGLIAILDTAYLCETLKYLFYSDYRNLQIFYFQRWRREMDTGGTYVHLFIPSHSCIQVFLLNCWNCFKRAIGFSREKNTHTHIICILQNVYSIIWENEKDDEVVVYL